MRILKACDIKCNNDLDVKMLNPEQVFSKNGYFGLMRGFPAHFIGNYYVFITFQGNV
jgi:hypothetical protein